MKHSYMVFALVVASQFASAENISLIDVKSHNMGYDTGYRVGMQCALEQIDEGKSANEAYKFCAEYLKKLQTDEDAGLDAGRPHPVKGAKSIKDIVN